MNEALTRPGFHILITGEQEAAESGSKDSTHIHCSRDADDGAAMQPQDALFCRSHSCYNHSFNCSQKKKTINETEQTNKSKLFTLLSDNIIIYIIENKLRSC